MRLEVEGDESSEFKVPKKTLTINLNNFQKNAKNEKRGDESRVEALTFHFVCHNFAGENKNHLHL